jgi:hypothetical protein
MFGYSGKKYLSLYERARLLNLATDFPDDNRRKRRIELRYNLLHEKEYYKRRTEIRTKHKEQKKLKNENVKISTKGGIKDETKE